jgi:DNA-directed RNA polymerase specialized sigma24 family protein
VNANGTASVLDMDLVRRSMQWDEEAFRKIYEATYYRMLYIAKKYMKNDTAAEDVLQMRTTIRAI